MFLMEIFVGLENLIDLNLCQNKLIYLFQNVFSKLTSLQSLHLGALIN